MKRVTVAMAAILNAATRRFEFIVMISPYSVRRTPYGVCPNKAPTTVGPYVQAVLPIGSQHESADLHARGSALTAGRDLVRELVEQNARQPESGWRGGHSLFVEARQERASFTSLWSWNDAVVDALGAMRRTEPGVPTQVIRRPVHLRHGAPTCRENGIDRSHLVRDGVRSCRCGGSRGIHPGRADGRADRGPGDGARCSCRTVSAVVAACLVVPDRCRRVIAVVRGGRAIR